MNEKCDSVQHTHMQRGSRSSSNDGVYESNQFVNTAVDRLCSTCTVAERLYASAAADFEGCMLSLILRPSAARKLRDTVGATDTDVRRLHIC